MLLKGKESLSDSELLAIILGSGTKGENVIELSKRILKESGNKLNNLARLDVKEVTKFKGIAKTKAIKILASLELGRRLQSEEITQGNKVKTSKDAFNYLSRFLSHKNREEFWVLYLNNSNTIISHKCIAQGGITQTTADIRLIFEHALNCLATSIILAHNHPSGNLFPSDADRQLTKRIKDGGNLLSISVLDHVIVTDNAYYSFADEGIM